LEENMGKEGYSASVQNEIATIKTKIMGDKRTEILNHKDDIVKELERMIVERYAFQKGQIKITLRNDSEVVDAIKLLENPAKYKSILKKQ
jgi:carboxyl-terminal processing protease